MVSKNNTRQEKEDIKNILKERMNERKSLRLEKWKVENMKGGKNGWIARKKVGRKEEGKKGRREGGKKGQKK